MIGDQNSEIESIPSGSGHHVEEPVTTVIESLAYYMNPLFTDPLIQPLINPPSMRYIDAYSSYNLPPGSFTTQFFGMNPRIFAFPKGLGNLSLSTTHVVDTVGASSLLGTSVIRVTPTQPLVNTYPFTNGLGIILSSLFSHRHTPSALLGRSIGQMVRIQFVHTTMVTQDTQSMSPILRMGIYLVGSIFNGRPTFN